MDKALKSKLIMFAAMVIFMLIYATVFGSKNMVIGVMVVMAAFMGLGNDLSFKPKTSFVKILCLLLILGIVSFLNNPITLFGCILTFIVVFGTTFTSYHLFGTSVYMPFLMCYLMMLGIPITLDQLPMRLLSLVFGAIFIVGLNIIINKKKSYKLSQATIYSLIDELNNAIDVKIDNGEVSSDNFKTVNGFYLAIFNKFEYKYFPSETQKAVLNVVKAFQSIGSVIAEFDLSKRELNCIKKVLSNLNDIDFSDISKMPIDTKEMYRVLLNLEIIASEVKNKDLTKDTIIPDKKTVKELIRPIMKRQFSFKSPKFTFAFKMALMLFVWELLTLIFNLPFTKWLYFVTVPLMLPYINDLKYTARTRIQGTFVGIFIFAIILIIMPYLPISFMSLMMIVMVVCMLVMILKLEDKLILTSVTTVMSVMTALMYIEPPEAMFLKILWVVVGVIVVSIFNFKFLPYSVETETENNLKACHDLNKQSIGLIKEKCKTDSKKDKTIILVMSNIIRENIEVTEDNSELYDLQLKITDTCNFILSYLDINEVSEKLKINLVDIINKDVEVDNNLNLKDSIIAYSMKHVMKMFKEEEKLL